MCIDSTFYVYGSAVDDKKWSYSKLMVVQKEHIGWYERHKAMLICVILWLCCVSKMLYQPILIFNAFDWSFLSTNISLLLVIDLLSDIGPNRQ